MWVFHLCGHFFPFVCWVGYQQFFQIWFCSMAAYNSLLCFNAIGNLFIHKTRCVSDSFLVEFVVSNQSFFPCEKDFTIEIHSSNLKQSHYLEKYYCEQVALRLAYQFQLLSCSPKFQDFLPQIGSNVSWITWLPRYLLKTSVQSTWQGRGEQNR